MPGGPEIKGGWLTRPVGGAFQRPRGRLKPTRKGTKAQNLTTHPHRRSVRMLTEKHHVTSASTQNKKRTRISGYTGTRSRRGLVVSTSLYSHEYKIRENLLAQARGNHFQQCGGGERCRCASRTGSYYNRFASTTSIPQVTRAQDQKKNANTAISRQGG